MSPARIDEENGSLSRRPTEPPISEVSYQHHVSMNAEDGENEMETSTLLGASTLTPTHVDKEGIKRNQNPTSLASCGHGYRKAFQLAALIGVICSSALFGADLVSRLTSVQTDSMPTMQRSKAQKAKKKDKKHEDPKADHSYWSVHTNDVPHFISADMIFSDANGEDFSSAIKVPVATERCDYIAATFEEQNKDITDMDVLEKKYEAQSIDPNVFYRATAILFWQDFGRGDWGSEQGASIDMEDLVLLEDATYPDGTPLSPLSTWTWVTGDQHLSNFGAFENRGSEVVFSVNDFDEAAIYDFQIDVLRVAVSICSHGFKNGFTPAQIQEALEAFTYTYVKTTIGYSGGDDENTFELNPYTSTGVLRDFLTKVSSKKSGIKQLKKFTEVGKDGVRKFSYTKKTRLEHVSQELEDKLRAEFTADKYGATMMHMGFKVRGWDDDFYTVLDIARRVGSGVGSFGTDRLYVLLKGVDTSIENYDDEDGGSVILDVKYEPKSAPTRILDDNQLAWYNELFQNEADRVQQGQRRLTSYTDPYIGYIVIDGDAFNVRQRSPYKAGFDLDQLTDFRDFTEFIEQISIATATAHSRGSTADAPGQFKHVIKHLMAGAHNRRRWSQLVAAIAISYRKQVLLDFNCFEQYRADLFDSEE